MEAISRLIFNLLARRQTVVLPGMGTLHTVEEPAVVDASGGLTVPRIRLSFSVVEEKTETLTEIIATQSGIPVKEIKPQYNRWLSKLRNASSDGELAIEGVVLLIRQPDGSYWAEPSRELDNLLNPIQPQKIQLPVLSSGKGKKNRPVSASSEQKKKSQQKSRAAWLAAGGAVLAVLIYWGYYAYTRGFFNPGIPEPAVSSVVSDPLPDLQQAAPAIPDTLQQSDNLGIVREDSLLSQENPVLPEAYTGEVYHVIAGVFSTKENAERYIGQIAFDESRITLIPTSNGRFMVSVGKYTDKEAADREMARLRKDFPQVWVSKRKK